jgi:hypothetical protein
MIHLLIGRFLEDRLDDNECVKEEVYEQLVHHYEQALKFQLPVAAEVNAKKKLEFFSNKCSGSRSGFETKWPDIIEEIKTKVDWGDISMPAEQLEDIKELATFPLQNFLQNPNGDNQSHPCKVLRWAFFIKQPSLIVLLLTKIVYRRTFIYNTMTFVTINEVGCFNPIGFLIIYFC